MNRSRSRRGSSAPQETPKPATTAPSGRGASRRRSASDRESEKPNRFDKPLSRGRSREKDDDPSLLDDTVAPKFKAGWDLVQKRKEMNDALDEERKNSLREFYLIDGESAEIQLLCDEPVVVEGHTIINKYGRYTFEPCQKIKQRHCLMCQSNSKLGWKAAFKILDFRGSYDKEKKEYRFDEPVEKLWLTNPTLAAQLNSFFSKKSAKPSMLSLLVDRSGSGKSTSYNIQIATDEDNRMIAPEENYKEEKASLEEALAPKSDEALEALGFSLPDYE